MSKTPETEVVEDFFAAMSAGEVERLLDLLDEDLTYTVSGSFPIAGDYDKAGFEANLRGEHPEYRRPEFDGPLKLTITGVTAQGERVAVEADSDGKLPGGDDYHNEYHYLFVVRDRKIVEWKQYCDTILANEVFCSDELRR
jgi:uncharacterized protein